MREQGQPDSAATLVTAAARVDRALADLGATGRVSEGVVADAVAQVSACAIGLRLAVESFPEPGALMKPTDKAGART